ncbi:conjugal transfer protein TraB [Campylobacter sp. MIT 12-8780]|uniref:TraB/VirB10 family protein n=1 Tax=unclassified Campylobacter TaxID=2593542 RepID=UPI00115DBD0F|nr:MULTISPECIES: TraB/VirB10 family protein [unclassified Campylobacter]NDJ27680.1 conjugal transfer protein TraB [Campylobacter sp. MIT 19-121]TQR40844.1 conjugal transfer protein TraB [Campylobacter sp. MIT 12-8780]
MNNPFLKFFSNDKDPNNAQKNQSKNKIIIFIGLIVTLGCLMFLVGDKKQTTSSNTAGNFKIVEENPTAKTQWVGSAVDDLALAKKDLINLNTRNESLAKEVNDLKKLIIDMQKENANYLKNNAKDETKANEIPLQPTTTNTNNQTNSIENNDSLYKNFPMPTAEIESQTLMQEEKFGLTKLGEVPDLEEVEEIRYTPIEGTLSFTNVTQPKPKEEKPKKLEGHIIPTGSIIKAVLLSGMDAPTMTQAKSSPLPVLMKVTDLSILPNYFAYDIVDCFLMGEGYGDLTAERAYIRVNNISCITNKREHIDMALRGAVSGEDGKLGLKGEVITKQGALLARTLIAGFLQGVGESFANQNQIITSGWGGTTTQTGNMSAGESLQAGAFKGLSSSAEKLADFYLKMADQVTPVIEISAGREINVLVTEMTALDTVNNQQTADGKKPNTQTQVQQNNQQQIQNQ